MTVQPADLYAQLDELRKDLSRCQARVTEVYNLLRQLNLPTAEEVRCSRCGVPFRSQRALDEHDYNSHGGSVPAHLLAAEARIEEAA